MFKRMRDWFRRKDREDDYYAGRGGSENGGGMSMAAEEARFRSDQNRSGQYGGPFA